MTPTAIEDPGRCYVCHRQPATTYGMCLPCLERACWFIDPLPWEH